jgi:hypothetical protein
LTTDDNKNEDHLVIPSSLFFALAVTFYERMLPFMASLSFTESLIQLVASHEGRSVSEQTAIKVTICHHCLCQNMLTINIFLNNNTFMKTYVCSLPKSRPDLGKGLVSCFVVKSLTTETL